MFGDFRLQVFMALSRTGNFTRAADELGISQPAVSQNIAGLEKELGVRLFVRNRGEAVLTPAGKVFMEYAGHILYWYGSASSMFGAGKSAEDGGESGPVRMAAGADLMSCVVPDLAASVSALVPGVSFIVDEIGAEWDRSWKIAGPARPGNVSLDVSSMPDHDAFLFSMPVSVGECPYKDPLKDDSEMFSGMDVPESKACVSRDRIPGAMSGDGISGHDSGIPLKDTHIADVPACVFASPVSRHARGHYLSLQDIPARIAISAGFSAYGALAVHGRGENPDFMQQDAVFPGLAEIPGADIVPKIVFISPSPDAVKRFVASMPDTVGILPFYCVRKELRDGTLVQVPVPGLPFRRSVHFAASGPFVSSPLCGLLKRRLSEMLGV